MHDDHHDHTHAPYPFPDEQEGYTYESLRRLAARMVRFLHEKIESGKATAADLNVAVVLVRDNRILAEAESVGAGPGKAVLDEETQRLMDELPPPNPYYEKAAAEQKEDERLRREMQASRSPKKFH